MNSSKVTVYIRHSGTLKYEKANAKTFTGYKGKLLDGSTFALQFTDAQGKRQYETLGCQTWDEANEAAFYKRIELSKTKRGEIATPTLKPVPAPKPIIQTTKTGRADADAAIDKYLANVAIRSGKTQNPYGYTMQQFYASCRNKPHGALTAEKYRRHSDLMHRLEPITSVGAVPNIGSVKVHVIL